MLPPMLLGMNNPGSDDPAMALDPMVPRTAGARLFELARTGDPSIDEATYRAVFERRNLINNKRWVPLDARRAAARLRGELAAGGPRTVIALGREVRDLLRVPLEWPWILRRDMGAWQVRCLPHPSGLCRWYNDPNQRQTAAILLAELAAAQLRSQGGAGSGQG